MFLSDYWYYIALTFVGALLLIASNRLRSLCRDIKNLDDAIRVLSRGKPSPQRLNFSTDEVSSAWNAAMILASRNRANQTSEKAFEEVISLSSSITRSSREVASTAKAVADLLLRQCAPEVVAVAVIRRKRATNSLIVEHTLGIPRKRLDNALVTLFENLIEQKERIPWGHFLPSANSEFDFSAFGVAGVFTSPLKDSGEVCGGIFLGFRRVNNSLSPNRLTFISAICEQCAASFDTALEVQEKIEESEREKDFLIGMSHDLRSPGNSALYSLRDLMSGELGSLTENQKSKLDIIEDCLEEQLDILTDVLDYAKHQRGLLNANKREFSLNTALDTTFNKYSILANRKSIELIVDQIPQVECNGDPRQIKRIISNLVTNAIKYTDEGSVHVRFRLVDSLINMSVEDTGIGVPLKEQELLFREFSRMTNASDRQGVGLGLLVAQTLAQLNGGNVAYRPNSTRGSIFELSLPVLKKLTSLEVSQKINSILLVDDDPAVCRTNKRYLDPIAEQIVSAQSCEEAFKVIKSSKPDVVITDYYLGNKTAFELLENLNKAKIVVPTILLSGSGLNWELEYLQQSYAVEILEKPVDRQLLREAVSRILS